ncbi:MAG: RNA polymerase sigma factor [Pseudomonadota bacterium]
MKILDPGLAIVQAATDGDLAALDALLLAIQPGIYNLAVRMLGNRDDAADATQEILLKVITHLSGFRRESAFTTWVFQVARNHLLTAITRARESPEVSLDSLAERLQQGIEFSLRQGDPYGGGQALRPEEKIEARQIALGCTQNMLMAIDREQRLAYVLDAVFGLPSKEAAEVLGISAAAYRQRLSRARAKLDAFTRASCGLANPAAACSCERQMPALRQARAAGLTQPGVIASDRSEREAVERQFDALVRMVDAAALFRAHPEYRVPASLQGAIRAVLSQEGYWDEERPLN